MKTLLLSVSLLCAAGCGGHLQQVHATADGQVRLQTTVGVFVTREPNVEELERLLAGEPTQRPHFSLSDLDASTFGSDGR